MTVAIKPPFEIRAPFEIGSRSYYARFRDTLSWPPSESLLRQLQDLEFTDQEIATLCLVSAADVQRLKDHYDSLSTM
jgi:hypothetical protein